MKWLVPGSTVVALGLLTAGCSNGSGSKAAATSEVTSATGIEASSPNAVATSAAAGSSGSSPGATAASTPATGQPSAAGTQSGAAGATTAGGTTASLAVCSTLPTAQVASLSAKTLTHSREEDAAGLDRYTCGYFAASGFGGMSVTVKTAGGVTAYANTLSTDTIEGAAEDVTPLAGIGDKAFSAHDGVHAVFGDRMISVAGLTSVPQAEAIIKALQAKLT